MVKALNISARNSMHLRFCDLRFLQERYIPLLMPGSRVFRPRSPKDATEPGARCKSLLNWQSNAVGSSKSSH